ncbi:MAG TPA: hypothetical protein VFD70_06650 [Anaerolineae bacterium]|nr:hypothetical protein [Anaerolineae bacterium]
MNRLRTYIARSRVLTVALVVTVIAVMVAVVYGFERYDFNFLDNLIATSVGVLFGLVLGLFTNSLEVSDQRAQAENQARTRAQDILKRIQTELEYNFKILAQRIEFLNAPSQSPQKIAPRIMLQYRLNLELWDALRLAGDLSFIEDLGLLEAITSAYHRLRTIAFIEEQSLIKQYTMPDSPLIEGLTDEERAMLPIAAGDVKAALDRIGRALGA